MFEEVKEVVEESLREIRLLPRQVRTREKRNLYSLIEGEKLTKEERRELLEIVQSSFSVR